MTCLYKWHNAGKSNQKSKSDAPLKQRYKMEEKIREYLSEAIKKNRLFFPEKDEQAVDIFRKFLKTQLLPVKQSK